MSYAEFLLSKSQAVKNVQMAAAGRKDIETSEAFDFSEEEAA